MKALKNERIEKLSMKWLNYNPWHDELGRFTFAWKGSWVAPTNGVTFDATKSLTKAGEGNVVINQKDFPYNSYRPDKGQSAASQAVMNENLDAKINKVLQKVSQAKTAEEAANAFNAAIQLASMGSGNYVYTTGALRNWSRTFMFQPTKGDLEAHATVAGDPFSKSSQVGTKINMTQPLSALTSKKDNSVVARNTAAQNGGVSTILKVSVPEGTAIAIPKVDTWSATASAALGKSTDVTSSIALPAGQTYQVTNVGKIRKSTDAQGNTIRVRTVNIKLVPREKAIDQIDDGTYERGGKDDE